MKNFLSNKSIRNARGVLTGLLMAMLFGALLSPLGGGIGAVAFVAAFVGSVLIATGYSNSERRSMSFACGAISTGLLLDCNHPIVSGVYATVYLCNRADIDYSSVTYDSANGQLVTGLSMKAGKTFFVFEGRLNSSEPSWQSVKGKYINTFTHELIFRLFDITADTYKQVNQIAQGDVVAIVRNNFDGTVTGNTRYDILGLGTGLKCEVAQRVYSSADDNGGITITLKTADYAREAGPAHRFFITDAATTETAIAVLLD